MEHPYGQLGVAEPFASNILQGEGDTPGAFDPAPVMGLQLHVSLLEFCTNEGGQSLPIHSG